MPNLKESGVNHIVSSLPVTPDRDYSHLGSKFDEVEEHLREANALNGSSMPNEIKKVALMNIVFEDLRLYVR